MEKHRHQGKEKSYQKLLETKVGRVENETQTFPHERRNGLKVFYKNFLKSQREYRKDQQTVAEVMGDYSSTMAKTILEDKMF